MPRPIKSPLKPTKFEDLDPRTQDFIKEKGLKKKSGGKKDPNNVIIKKQKPNLPRPNPPKSFEKNKSIKDIVKQVVAEGGSPSLIQDEARMDRIDKLVGVIPSEKMAKGGRVMYKSGMRVCKLAKRGKGRAYGKNS